MKDEVCFIIGNGPSLNRQKLKLIEGCASIGINRSFLAMETSVIIWQDSNLWDDVGEALKRRPELLVCRDVARGSHRARFTWTQVFDFGWQASDNPLELKCERETCSTGSLAIEMAFALGFRQVVLLGIDCKQSNGKTDFYGVNKHHHAGTMDGCVSGLINMKRLYGVENVKNCGDNDVFEQCDLRETLKEFKPNRKDQKEWRRLFRGEFSKYVKEVPKEGAKVIL